ncbi:creatinine amidohydrolase [Pullulanibacillus camelliae]|uniref:Creatinine amidohydrolase n=1 Tax=Pullulanibacillus camelliae TaxID=1707096 RepID=A0A8J2VGQ2_9BACL|nr:creatininase family protein [Pullulanibacillus camelliae]GGE30348.1 creatinine amidohydrolase [Pullulanibacillus camelliae]
MEHIHELMTMTRDEVEEAVKTFPVAVLPLGATEQHGHHLPMGVDIFLAEALAKQVCQETGALLLPSIPFGYSWVWRDIPGTITLQQHHVEDLIKDVAHSVARYGIKLLVLINGHDSNKTSMKYATRELVDEIDMPVVYLFYPDLDKTLSENCNSSTWHGMIHACEFETSLMLAVNERLVDMEKAVKEYPKQPDLYGKSSISLGTLSQSGVFGDATQATKEKGEKMFKQFTDKMSALVKEACEEFNIKSKYEC